MSGKVLFRIEHYFNNAWLLVKVRLLESHNFARHVEWHDTLDTATEYARREIENAKARAPYRKNEFRVTDHIGNVHWKDPQ
jgi:hypothetical protein